ncbi:uncharacterized protein PAC_13211 [Phialocephala subalpina]|uniref:NDT80 domain-containing protein n=1 Tax=Phialocephala subalpina TaxID=576137 RepID=A0A1L7XE59_9HELO|nr:uncharacterized protein PAC_13211 [Phialocephala subalpina]
MKRKAPPKSPQRRVKARYGSSGDTEPRRLKDNEASNVADTMGSRDNGYSSMGSKSIIQPTSYPVAGLGVKRETSASTWGTKSVHEPQPTAPPSPSTSASTILTRFNSEAPTATASGDQKSIDAAPEEQLRSRNYKYSIESTPCLPFFYTDVIHSLRASDGHIIYPEIFGGVDSGGFFIADSVWTCYRRNFFSLSCSFTLTPSIPNGPVYLVHRNEGESAILQVYNFAMSIAAVVDGKDGNSIDLIQFTSERIPLPTGGRPAQIMLAPRSSTTTYEPITAHPDELPIYAKFNRIQFKTATPNNGQRIGRQDHYHLLLELFADTGSSNASDRWIKIASRMSVQLVVRGRSPSYYQRRQLKSNVRAPLEPILSAKEAKDVEESPSMSRYMGMLIPTTTKDKHPSNPIVDFVRERPNEGSLNATVPQTPDNAKHEPSIKLETQPLAQQPLQKSEASKIDGYFPKCRCGLLVLV